MPSLLVTCLALALAAGTNAVPVRAPVHLYDLAATTGRVPSTWARLVYDRAHHELFVVDEGFVRVFNEAGMEVHRFGDDGELGIVSGLAVLEDGTMIALSSTLDGRRMLVRCNFRGERIEELTLRGLPRELEGSFVPDVLVHSRDGLYLAELRTMRVVVVDEAGTYRRWVSLAKLLKTDPKKDADAEIAGFDVDPSGDLLFTMPMLFAAFVVSPAGEVRSFGSRGSTPGKFNIAGAIAADENGNFLVTDRLRSVLMVFDRELRFRGEFGYRGDGWDNLVVPYHLAVGNGMVFVAQAGDRGVRAFKVEIE
jgi:hypothetical protein